MVVVLDLQPAVAIAHQLVFGFVDDAVGEKAVQLLEILLLAAAVGAVNGLLGLAPMGASARCGRIAMTTAMEASVISGSSELDMTSMITRKISPGIAANLLPFFLLFWFMRGRPLSV